MLIVDSDLFLTFSGRGMLASTRPSFGMLGFLFWFLFFPGKPRTDGYVGLFCFVCFFFL